MSRPGLAQHMVRNLFFSGITSLADTLLLVLLILAGRLLGADEFGVFSLGLAMSSLLVFATNLGLDALLVRELAVGRGDAVHLTGAVLTWKLVLSLAALALYYLACSLFLDDATARHVAYLMGPAALFRSFNMTFRSVFQGIEQFSKETRIVVTERVALLVLGFMVLVIQPSALWFAAAFLVARGGTLVLYVATVRNVVGAIRPVWDAPLVSRFQITAFPLGVSTIIFGLSMQAEILMLGWFRQPGEVGLYSAAMKIFEGALVIPLIFNSVFYPRLSHASEHDPGQFGELSYRVLKYVMIIAVPVVLLGLFHAPDMMSLLFGAEYAAAAPVLSVLLVAVALQFIVTVFYTQFRALGEMKQVMRIMLVGLLVKVGVGLLAIPAHGVSGAALAAVLSVTTALLLALYRLHRRVALERRHLTLALRILAAAASASLVHLVFPGLSLLPSLAGMALVFITALFLLGIVDRSEVRVVRSLLDGGRAS